MTHHMCKYGKMYVFDTNDLISKSLVLYGEWAQNEINIMKRLINHGDHIVDIGAFIGTHSRAFADAVGPSGLVWAFEPNPKTLSLLRKNACASIPQIINVVGMALGDTNETTSLSINESGNYGASHIGTENKDECIVSTSTLDSFNLSRVDFIKIDVEGFEANVLIGASKTIERYKPLIFLEINSINDGYHHISWARSNNYELYGIISDAYNKNNFLLNNNNVFGAARECGLLLIPQGITIDSIVSKETIAIESLDDMALFLLHKKQYVNEVMSHSHVADKLGLHFSSPLSDKLCLDIDNLQLQVSSLEADRESILKSRSWRLTKPLRNTAHVIRISRNLSRNLSRVVNLRRFKKAARLVINGDWRGIYRKINKILSVDNFHNNYSLNGINSHIEWSEISGCILDNTQSFKYHRNITIIIPVYNNFDHLHIFFESIFLNTAGNFSLLVIDDASSDPRVGPFLTKQQDRFPSMSLLTNSSNKGFVKTVNRGMKNSNGDVVLLNTDTIVPSGWLERLLQPLQNEDVASVTPFTNAGTICSFPIILEDNKPIYGLSVESIDAAFKKLVNKSIEIPTAVGFCMAISRKSIGQVGYFDAEAFGKGYGEENDWCMRAAQSGYRHVLCTNLYIHHTHGGSFLPEEKQALLVSNLKTIKKRYPNYIKLIKSHIENDIARTCRETARLLLMLRPENKPILIIDHARGGGANHFSHGMINKFLNDGISVAIFTEDYIYNTVKITCYYGCDSMTIDMNNTSDLKDFIEKIQFNEVHYNSLVFSHDPLSVVDILCGISERSRVIFHVHDFFSICPSYTLLNDHDEFCGIPDIDRCKACIKQNREIFPNAKRDIQVWRGHWRRLLDRSDVIRCFSDDSSKHLERVYPEFIEKIIVDQHDISYFNQVLISPSLDGVLHIGIIGSISKQKGAKIVQDFSYYIEKNNLPCKITLIGEIDPAYKLPSLVNITEKYDYNDLPKIISERSVQIIWFPSIIPETFSYVTAECMAMGLPITAFDIGAPAERLKKYPKSFIHKSNSPKCLYEDFIEFRNQLLAT